MRLIFACLCVGWGAMTVLASATSLTWGFPMSPVLGQVQPLGRLVLFGMLAMALGVLFWPRKGVVVLDVKDEEGLGPMPGEKAEPTLDQMLASFDPKKHGGEL